jgi:glycosyltransferase involved in cell wall biosynthesis
VLNYEYPPIGGGASPVTGAVCRELAKLGNQVDVVTMAFRDLPREEVDGNLRVIRVPCLRSARHICYMHELFTYVIAAFFCVRRLLRRQSYDLIHAHFFFPSGIVAYALSRQTGIPYVVTAHGSDVEDYNPDRFRRAHRILAPLWRRVLRGARAATSPSESLAELIRAHNGRTHPIEIIPNGIREDWIEPAAKARSILLVSRLFPRKGAQYLLEALRLHPLGYEVHIVGDGPYRVTLEQMARDLPDQVYFHGWLNNGSAELHDLYRQSGLFVFPSIAENFPICLLEAMISGAAVIATNLKACREVLGEAACFVPPKDPGAIARALAELTQDEGERIRLGTAARNRVLELFTWNRVGRQYHDFFASLVNSDPPSGGGPA